MYYTIKWIFLYLWNEKRFNNKFQYKLSKDGGKMLGLVCMLDGKGMKKGVSTFKNFDLEKVKEVALFNLDYTLECIQFCLKNGYIYRVSSSIQKVY